MCCAPSFKILIAEDNGLNAKFIRKILEFCGHSTQIVGDGIEAVETARENRFDIILMDLEMPNMDGFTAAREIRKFDDETPILSISSPNDCFHVRRCLENGMDGHINKSAPVEEYRSKIEAAVLKRKNPDGVLLMREILQNEPLKK